MKVRSVGLFSLILLGLLNYFTASPSIEEPTVGTGAPPEYLSIQDLDNITFEDYNDKTKNIKVPIKSIPEFNEIYSELDNDNLKRMELGVATRGMILLENKDATYLLLKYQCGVKLCDSLLLKKENEKITTLPINETFLFADYQFSSDKKSLALSYITIHYVDFHHSDKVDKSYTVYIVDLPTFKIKKTLEMKQDPDFTKLLN
ncbi:hypothetical protein [Brevibacillus laterosporus]|uniref:Uncharacterized protein n=1 Tax=Brevibacillus laterosporus TaxID=1465 RepID=A0AAP3DJ61_BRELA|nr:hypothetical protein [Brevibacillus laterosporus]MCR8982071.1 hypothetical protein [Brevibacillus laterosporus]MCZ0809226.1 hypothetical protein [Brevibacillus laterosporus]MCZ0827583.1 hypothetical protein [Brevibacillus laterosporus]MCZ0851541.1 hypothetical protein [Brevibacillus laterosporus]MED1666448.1 hypothetical protein [Brevibacillus laterosporus]